MKTKNRFLTSPFWLGGFSFIILLLYFLYILVFFISPKENLERSTYFTIITMKIMFGILPTLMLILFSNHCFSIITIDQSGIHKALFKYFLKKDYRWEDIKELRIFNRVDSWLFIGKVPMVGLDYYKLIKHKKIMQMSFRPSILKAIRQYSDMKIENLDENRYNELIH